MVLCMSGYPYNNIPTALCCDPFSCEAELNLLPDGYK
jgi:hypothetical protein